MPQLLKTIAVLIANPALSSILTMTLAAVPSLRVRAFESETALRAYLDLAPIDLVVTDLGGDIVRRIRNDARAGLQVIALQGAVGEVKRADGIDEVIMKPMSPRYLVERVLARLARSAASAVRRRGLHDRDWSRFGDNIIPLFPQQPGQPGA
jgi:two-component system phosphate regulon response regulator PhoB